jgi:hypothetical protein
VRVSNKYGANVDVENVIDKLGSAGIELTIPRLNSTRRPMQSKQLS